ncbi:pca operon transcription factor PcaQ [Pelagibacterium lentulum]|uniref:HTH-type transcriptional regulator PcaQ n=1 Tax=Pelagibacterium lentulum TaxID=2029865 RepID=A0A916RPL9_9HYPH|nr:pca operon transcription factor PcaQ [Pelagibacterium lentulum]GGA61576.1 pca operon transcription factor PcaQ [Pelagibacterium lentulum]
MIDSRIRFRHLRTFVEAARQGSISRAAEILNVTQPAVTKTMRELEDILGVKLFEKDGRGIKITRYGEVFLRHAGASIAAVQQGVDSLNRGNAGPPIRVGALPTVSARIMPKAMRQFLIENTETLVKIVTGENTVLLDQLRSGQLDLVIGRLAAPEQMTGLAFDYLYSEQVRFAVRKDHPLLDSKRLDFARLPEFPILMPPGSAVIRPFVDRFLLAHGMAELPHVIETVSDSFGRAFVQQTDAVWIISEGVISQDVAAGLLAWLPLDTGETKGSVGLTTRKATEPNAPLDILVGTIRETVNQLRL